MQVTGAGDKEGPRQERETARGFRLQAPPKRPEILYLI